MEQKQEQQISQVKQVNIFQRILGVMSELAYIQKGPKTVNGQYRYASHDQVSAALHPFLVKYGIACIPTVEECIHDGNRTIIKLVTCFINSDNPSDQFSIRSIGFGIDSGDKGPGKAVSYAFKMACLKVFCLETGEDPDSDANSFYEPPKCQEFDSIIPADMSEKDRAKLVKFLAHSSQSLKKHVEDVKREALTRPDDFMKAFKNWKPKKEE